MKRFHAVCWILAVTAGACASAQAPAPAPPRPVGPSTAVSSTPPAASSVGQGPPAVPLRDVQLPEIARRQTSSGLSVWHVGVRTVPLVHLRLIVDTSAPDDASKPGLSRLTALALAKGAAASLGGKGTPQLADRIQVEVTPRTTTFSLAVADREAQDAIQLLGAMLAHAAFRQVDTEAARKLTTAPAQDTGASLWPSLRRMAVGEAADGTPGGSPSGVALSGLDVQTFYRTRYGAKRSQLVVVGSVGLDEATRAAENALGGWTGGVPSAGLAEAPARDAATIELIDDPGVTRAQVVAVVPAPAQAGESWAATWLAANIVRQAAAADCARSSRFEATAPVLADRPAYFAFCVDAAPDAVPDRVQRLMGAAHQLGERAPSGEALLGARKAALDWLAVQASSGEGLAELLSLFARFGADPAFLRDVGANLRGVAPEEVSQAARTRLSAGRWLIAVRGPGGSLRTALSRVGTVQETPGADLPRPRSAR